MLNTLLFIILFADSHPKHVYHKSTENIQSSLDKLVYKRQLSCPVDDLPCSSPLNYEETKQFLCNEDDYCPVGYLCCEDSCFVHKICKRIYGLDTFNENCPPENVRCAVPFSDSYWNNLACLDGECPEGHKCCSDSCFYFKVCKKVETVKGTYADESSKSNSSTINQNIPSTTHEVTEFTTSIWENMSVQNSTATTDTDQVTAFNISNSSVIATTESTTAKPTTVLEITTELTISPINENDMETYSESEYEQDIDVEAEKEEKTTTSSNPFRINLFSFN